MISTATQQVKFRDNQMLEQFPVDGWFNRSDPFEGVVTDPQSLHKYTYVHNDPVNNIDPTGEFSLVSSLGSISIGKVLGAASIGAAIGAGFNAAANFSSGRSVFDNVGNAAAFGAVALPLSIWSPIVGVGIAGFGVFASGNLTYNVLTNPNSSFAQRGVAVTLFVSSLASGGLAVRNFQANGYVNPNAFRSTQATSLQLTRSSTLAELLAGTPDEALVHMTPATASQLGTGVRSGSWVRFGDVKHMTVQQYRAAVVGGMAPGGSPNAATVAIRLPSSRNATLFRQTEVQNFAGVPEFVNTSTVAADAIAIVE